MKKLAVLCFGLFFIFMLNLKVEAATATEIDATDQLPISAFSASSVWGVNGDIREFGPQRAFDNVWDENNGGYQSGRNASLPQWIQVDLGEPKTITKLRYQADLSYNFAYGMKNFTVSASNDGTTWTKQYAGIALGNETKQEFPIQSTNSFRYWKITVLDTIDNKNTVMIGEMELISNPLSCLVDITDDLPASAFSSTSTWTIDGDSRKFGPQRAFDNVWNENNGGYQSGRNDTLPQSIQVTLDKPRSVTMLRYQADSSYDFAYDMKDFTVYASNDENTWIKQYAGTASADSTVQEFLIQSTDSFKYWKITALNTISDKSTVMIGEMELLGSPTTSLVDATDGLPAGAFQASSVWTINGDSRLFGPQRAFDNVWNENNGGYQSGHDDTLPQWIRVDLGSPKSITTLRYQADSSYEFSYDMKDFIVEASNDGNTWTRQYTGTALGTNTNQEFSMQSKDSFRYWKITALSTISGKNTVMIGEIELLTPVAVCLVDVTDHLPVTAFSSKSVWNTNGDARKFGPERAFDNVWNENNGGYQSSSNETLPQWIEVDLGKPYAITKLKYQADLSYNFAYDMKDFIISGSNDKNTWTQQYTGTALANSTKQEFPFQSTGSYRYWRITASSTIAGKNTLMIGEMELLALTSESNISLQ